jgi:hypothetical protein
MATLEITNNAPNGVVVWDPVFDDEILSAPGAVTYVEGTVLARKSLADAITEAADGGNTGNGTITLATVAPGSVVPLVGTYVLTVTTAVTNGGILQLVDPNGAIVASDLIMTAGAGAATVFETAGLQFTITDAATDFIVGDSFTMITAADGDIVVYDRVGAGGAQIPFMVLHDEEVFAGIGTVPFRPIISGRVRRGDLVVHGVGAITDAEADALRDFGILAQTTTQLAELDNQ